VEESQLESESTLTKPKKRVIKKPSRYVPTDDDLSDDDEQENTSEEEQEKRRTKVRKFYRTG